MARKVKSDSPPHVTLGNSVPGSVPVKTEPSVKRSWHASKRAWAMVLTGITLIAVGFYFGIRVDDRQAATLGTFPWHVLQFWSFGIVLLLVGANSDATVYSGKRGRKMLVSDPLYGIGFLIIVSHLVALAGIGLEMKVGRVMQWAMLTPAVMGAIGDFPRRLRRRR
jgi:hypothetical protein